MFAAGRKGGRRLAWPNATAQAGHPRQPTPVGNRCRPSQRIVCSHHHQQQQQYSQPPQAFNSRPCSKCASLEATRVISVISEPANYSGAIARHIDRHHENKEQTDAVDNVVVKWDKSSSKSSPGSFTSNRSSRRSEFQDYKSDSGTISGSKGDDANAQASSWSNSTEEVEEEDGDLYCSEEITYCDDDVKEETPPTPRDSIPLECTLSNRAKSRIRAHHLKEAITQAKLLQRVKQIEEEIKAMEKSYGDHSSGVFINKSSAFSKDEFIDAGHSRKKPVKRATKRMSMQSLALKQPINWKKPPLFPVHLNKTSELRRLMPLQTCLTGKCFPLPGIKDIQYSKKPRIPVRATRTCSLRAECTAELLTKIIMNEDLRVPWVNNCCNGIIQT